MNEKINQLTATFNLVATQIVNNDELQEGEKFLLLQRMFTDIQPSLKKFEKIKKEIEGWAKENLFDEGNGKSKEASYFGANVLVKYAYPKPTIDSNKALKDLEDAYAELNAQFNPEIYYKESTARKTVIIQSELN